MFAILLPVKEFARAKQRQSGWLAPAARQLLARAMFADVWDTLRTARRQHRLLVITSEPEVIARCRAERIECFIESAQVSHSDSVRAATAWAIEQGVTSLLSIPMDTPALAAEEISRLAVLAARYGVVVVPSADGTGTNALLRTPPDAIQPQFGPGSCRLHVEQAQAAGRACLVYPLAGLAADIDTPEDAARFLALNRECRTTELLREWLGARRGGRQKEVVCS